MLVHDRNPESMRTVPRVCAAGRDSVPAYAPRAFFFAYFSKNRPRAEKSLETLIPGYLGDTFWAPEVFRFFRFFNLPNIGLMLSSGDLDLRSGTRDFLFLLEDGLRDLGAGVRSLGSGVAGFGFPHPGSIYTYSRSTAPAAVMLKDMEIWQLIQLPSFFYEKFGS